MFSTQVDHLEVVNKQYVKVIPAYGVNTSEVVSSMRVLCPFLLLRQEQLELSSLLVSPKMVGSMWLWLGLYVIVTSMSETPDSNTDWIH